jgi:nicotinamidase-related amidase
MYTLVVVDMQAMFPDSLGKRVQDNCKRAIRKAVKNKAAIIFVEYKNYGPTLPCLTKLAKNYKKVYHTTKSQWDGSANAIRLVTKHNLVGSKFKVCGVYTECCVQATVEGLSKLRPTSKINLLSKACSSSSARFHNSGINAMRKLSNVRVYV